jgi:hypothetical protein
MKDNFLCFTKYYSFCLGIYILGRRIQFSRCPSLNGSGRTEGGKSLPFAASLVLTMMIIYIEIIIQEKLYIMLH